MRIDDPMWPAVREAARRILRDEGLALHLPVEFENQADELLLAMADAQPSKLKFPEIATHALDSVDVYGPEDSSLGRHSIRLGASEPGPTTCWIPLEVTIAWRLVLSACHELLLAGYPGCVGCGGPNSEDPWDEPQSRQNWISAQS